MIDDELRIISFMESHMSYWLLVFSNPRAN